MAYSPQRDLGDQLGLRQHRREVGGEQHGQQRQHRRLDADEGEEGAPRPQAEGAVVRPRGPAAGRGRRRAARRSRRAGRARPVRAVAWSAGWPASRRADAGSAGLVTNSPSGTKTDSCRREPSLSGHRPTDGGGCARMDAMRIVVLTGGIGGARFLLGVRAYAREVGAEVTAVVNVGDDLLLHGLKVCPDLDSVMYTLGGGADPERGWGRVGETLDGQVGAGRVRRRAELVRPRRQGHRHPPGAHHDAQRRLPAVRGDRGAGRPLAAGRTAAAGHRRPPGDPRGRGGPGRRAERAIHFQEWWVRYRAALPDPPVRLRRRGDREAGAGGAGGDRPPPTWCWSRRATRW